MNPSLIPALDGTAGLAILVAYYSVLGVLSIYGMHRYQMLFLYYRHRRVLRRGSRPNRELPRVTVQLPLYNELNVVERLIEAVCALDYPRDRLEIQVLDDSTDETAELVAEVAERHRAAGLDISQIRRTDRTGFKAGALDAGLRAAKGEFVAVFDADFVPPPGFLRELLPHFSDTNVGMVQARWDHLNRDYSLLTRVQSVLLDGHFVIEHAARNASGRFFNFNGTAGVWRRTCIAEAGGWQHDTLTEDLDLSYRAQLAGWRFLYLPETTAPAELPIEMDSFKSQQHRWAKGSIQTARKLLPRILSSNVPFRVKAEACFHLTANVAYPLMIVLSLLIFPAMMIRSGSSGISLLVVDLPLFLMATVSVTSLYVCSQTEIGRSGWRTGVLIPALMAVGIGLAVNNSRAVFEALGRRTGVFTRTPKYNVEGRARARLKKRYRGARSFVPVIEAALALYLTGAVATAIALERWAALPFLMLFFWGYLFTSALSIAERLRFRTGTPAASGPRSRVRAGA